MKKQKKSNDRNSFLDFVINEFYFFLTTPLLIYIKRKTTIHKHNGLWF